MIPIQIIRDYNGNDAQMTEFARVIHTLMVDDLISFTAFDSTFTQDFAANFLTAIDLADVVVADTAVIDIQVQKTELIQIAMEKAKNKYADVKYFVKKTFPKSLGTQNEFGLNDYDRARKSSTQMIQFLDEMHKACVKYQPQLITNGFNEAAITEILSIRTELQNANTNQEVFKKQRTKMTEDRIITLNNCYQYIQIVNAAAQRVYKNNYAKQNQFVYKLSSSSSTLFLDGVVPASTTVLAGEKAFSLDNVFSFKNTGLVPLVFCLSTTNNVEGIEVTIGGGATVIKSSGELNADANKILVKNSDSTTIGSYEIEIED
jgi:hypothetical protein